MLTADNFKHYVDAFNADDVEDIVNLYSNAQTWEWMKANAPLLDCPDEDIRRIWYYRWWTYRKHLKQTPAGIIVTEFFTPVRHAGLHNSISCALGHHLAEGRWIREKKYLDEYMRFWFIADEGKPEKKFHSYSSWFHAAAWDRYCVTGDKAQLLTFLDDFIADYKRWEEEKLLPTGLFWQFDVRDGMEESISGSRKAKNFRPTINSYMVANARAIADMLKLAGRDAEAPTWLEKAESLRKKALAAMWDEKAKFFKAQTEEGPLCDAREAIGFIPWAFNLPDKGAEEAWADLVCTDGFWAPHGLTTAERRHPKFRSHGVGDCEWDGAVWPFATSQTLDALANVLRHYEQPYVTKQHYLESMQIYARCHTMHGKSYLGEYLSETTGEWLKGDNPRSRYYNHSTFNDLVLCGLVGIVPHADGAIEIDPLLPENAWDYFCVDNVPYHGRLLTIAWDKTGQRYGKGAGLYVLADGAEVARVSTLKKLTAT